MSLYYPDFRAQYSVWFVENVAEGFLSIVIFLRKGVLKLYLRCYCSSYVQYIPNYHNALYIGGWGKYKVQVLLFRTTFYIRLTFPALENIRYFASYLLVVSLSCVC